MVEFIRSSPKVRIALRSIYFRFLLGLLLIWASVVFVRGVSFDKSLISLFGHYLSGWAWFTPLAIVFGSSVNNWQWLIKQLRVQVIIVLILTCGLRFYSETIAFGLLELHYGLSFIVILSSHEGIFRRRLGLLSLISYLILSIYVSQRANYLFLFLILLFFSWEYFGKNRSHKERRFFLFICLFSTTFFVLMLLSKSTALELDGDLFMDTRTFLYEELFDDLDRSEMLIGRGALGKYFSPWFYNWSQVGGDHYYRSVVESGYLQMILKGGYVLFFLHLGILIPSAFLGIFGGKNIYVRSAGYTIISYLILWPFSYYSVYSAEYLLLWMAVGATLSPKIRNLKDCDFKGNNVNHG